MRAGNLKKLEDFTDADKIAVTAIKVSIPAIVMQMYAAEKYGLPEATRFDKYTVSMTHPDGVMALLGGSGAISAHFTSPPFHQRERKDPRVHTIMTSDDVMKGSTTFTMLSTTTAFREKNPKAVAAVLAALEESTRMIREDHKMAADVLLSSTTESGFSAGGADGRDRRSGGEVHDDAGERHEVRGVHAPHWHDQDSSGILEGSVLSGNPRSAGKLTADRIPAPAAS